MYSFVQQMKPTIHTVASSSLWNAAKLWKCNHPLCRRVLCNKTRGKLLNVKGRMSSLASYFFNPTKLVSNQEYIQRFPTMKFKPFQLICKNVVETFITQYYRNNIHTFYCMVFEGRVWIFSASSLFYYKKMACRNGVFIPVSFGRLEPLTFWTDSCDAFTTEAIRSC